jgi:hypothetical protein
MALAHHLTPVAYLLALQQLMQQPPEPAALAAALAACESRLRHDGWVAWPSISLEPSWERYREGRLRVRAVIDDDIEDLILEAIRSAI